MTDFDFIENAKRCRACGCCTKFCPAGTDVKGFIKLFLEGKMTEAGELLFRNNPLSACTSRVCAHELQCEGHCTMLRLEGRPVTIGKLEHHVSSAFLDNFTIRPEAPTGKKIAVAGAGPSGLTVAAFMAMRGHDVTVYEKNPLMGGMMRYSIPSFVLPWEIIDKLVLCLQRHLGVKFRPNTLVGETVTFDELKRDGFSALFIGTGTWKPRKLRIPGESLANCHTALDYLHDPDAFDLGDRTVIIGAGNTGMDVARTALRKGVKEAIIFQREGLDKVAARKPEVEITTSEGAVIQPWSTPLAIEPNGVRYTEKNPDTGETTEKFLPCSSVVVSISQGPHTLIGKDSGVEISERDLIVTDECGRTSRPGVFAHGDTVTGSRTVVHASASSRRAAAAMDEYVRSL
ncbi:MAG: FAD-dependent oxidoreductase [Pyramidobacter sp.]|nr:FAD-dependent oxidoreductase [Pyramidobacter sp.]